MSEQTDILLSRYFSGEASEIELRQLDKWLAESKENEAYFEKMTMIFQHSAGIKSMPKLNEEKAFSAFKNYIEKEKQTPFKRFLPYFSVAASIVLIIGIAFFIFKDSTNTIHIVADNNPIQQTLSNGVDVTLTAGTKLQYNPNDKNNVVLKKGEATFSVQPAQSGNLIVQAGEAFIKDIGTVFTVIAHNPDESITVEVTEGEVLFFTKNNTGIHLRQFEKGTYYPKENYFAHITANIENIKAIEFSATPLSEVIGILSAQYDVAITTNDEALNHLQISVSFDPNESIDNILAIISETLSLHVTKNSDGTYVLAE